MLVVDSFKSAFVVIRIVVIAFGVLLSMVVVSACKDSSQPWLCMLVGFAAMTLVGAVVTMGVWLVYRMVFPWGVPIPFKDTGIISPQYYHHAVRWHFFEFECSIIGVTIIGVAQILIGFHS